MPGSLHVFLGATRVGTFTNLDGDYNLFNFDQAYLDDPRRDSLDPRDACDRLPALSDEALTHDGAPRIVEVGLVEVEQVVVAVKVRERSHARSAEEDV